MFSWLLLYEIYSTLFCFDPPTQSSVHWNLICTESKENACNLISYCIVSHRKMPGLNKIHFNCVATLYGTLWRWSNNSGSWLQLQTGGWALLGLQKWPTQALYCIAENFSELGNSLQICQSFIHQLLVVYGKARGGLQSFLRQIKLAYYLPKSFHYNTMAFRFIYMLILHQKLLNRVYNTSIILVFSNTTPSITCKIEKLFYIFLNQLQANWLLQAHTTVLLFKTVFQKVSGHTYIVKIAWGDLF